MNYDFDLFVIGAGSGGVRAARLSAQNGQKVALAEEFRYGGTCVIRGCVPKKLMVYASEFSELFHDANGYGWSVGEYSFSWAEVELDASVTYAGGTSIRSNTWHKEPLSGSTLKRVLDSSLRTADRTYSFTSPLSPQMGTANFAKTSALSST